MAMTKQTQEMLLSKIEKIQLSKRLLESMGFDIEEMIRLEKDAALNDPEYITDSLLASAGM